MNRTTWNQGILNWLNNLPRGTFDLYDLLYPVLNARPQAHCGRFLAEDVSAGLFSNVRSTGRKGLNGQYLYEKI